MPNPCVLTVEPLDVEHPAWIFKSPHWHHLPEFVIPSVLEHRPDDTHKMATKSTDRLVVFLAFSSFLVVVRLGPRNTIDVPNEATARLQHPDEAVLTLRVKPLVPGLRRSRKRLLKRASPAATLRQDALRRQEGSHGRLPARERLDVRGPGGAR